MQTIFKNFIKKNGFIIASICFFIGYITDDNKGNAFNLVLAIVFFILGLFARNKN
mgnify:CR=1 FL=1|tara:strand:- start:250 stop:414 length:165 start_codon:yes stop_codon:yes gene_type:complete